MSLTAHHGGSNGNDASADHDVSQKVIQQLQNYIELSALLFLSVSRDVFSSFLSETNAAIVDFIKNDDMINMVLEQQSLSTSEDDDRKTRRSDEEDINDNGGDSDSQFKFLREIPADVFDNQNREIIKNYLIFTKYSQGILRENIRMNDQLMVNKFTPQLPFQSMLGYIRHNFVPIASLRVTADERIKASVSQKTMASKKALQSKNKKIADHSPAKGILEKLKELEIKLIESQDMTQLRDVILDPVAEISQWMESLDDEKKKQLVQGKADNIDVPSYVKDRKCLIAMLGKLKDWKEDIMSVVRRDRSTQNLTTTVKKEIKFWKAKMVAIQQIENQLLQPGVRASILVLMKWGYPVQARAFSNQVQIIESKKEVESQMDILQTFPIKSLVSSTTVNDIISAIGEIFQHFDAFRNKNNYPSQRINVLARAAARDVAEQLSEVLSKDIMVMKYSAFAVKTANTERLFHQFQNKYTRLRSDLRQRELLKNNKKFPTSWHRDTETELNGMQKRVEAIKDIRKGHSEIRRVIESTFTSSTKYESNQTGKINEAYSVFKKLDVLRCPESEWNLCRELYNNKINEVETEIQGMIRLAMEHATDPREMFRVCEKYNKLFVRDKIRQAVWEFQAALITNVQVEVKNLQQRYRRRYKNIPASKLSLLRDIPPVSGEVIWCRQLRRQLETNEIRLQGVLGAQWHNSPNAQELAEQINSFKNKLDPMMLVKAWEAEAKSLPSFDDQAPIFAIDTGINRRLSLSVSFDDNYVQLFKEVRCLVSLGIRIDIGLRLSIIDVKQKFPIAVKLKEAISIFTRTCNSIESYSNRDGMLSEVCYLVDTYKYQCQRHITKGMESKWGNHEKQLNLYVANLSRATIMLQDKTQKAHDLSIEVDKILTSLKKCSLRQRVLNSKIESLQSIVDRLDDGNFNAVPFWAKILNERLEKSLLSRVDEVLDEWMKTLDEDWGRDDEINVEESKEQFDDDDEVDTKPKRVAIRHQIKISSSQVLIVEPCIAEARLRLGQNLQILIAMITDLSRPHSDSSEDIEHTFRSILTQINTDKIVACYDKIEDICGRANLFADSWLTFQALWDMKLDVVFNDLGENIGRWICLLNDMKASQATTNQGNETEKSFGPIVVSFGGVRNKVESKYHEFRKLTFQALRSRLGELLRDFHKRATTGKQQLEDTDFGVATTNEIVKAVTLLQNLRRESENWMLLWKECGEGEKLLLSNRYQLGPTWMYASRIQAVLNDFFSVLNMRWNALKHEATNIYQKLEEQFDVIVQDVQELEEKWHAEKPVQGWTAAWNDDETVDWLRDYEGGILRPMIENFRTKGGDGRLLHAISKRDGQQKRHAIIRTLEITDENMQNNLINAMEGLLFTHADVHNCLKQFEDRVAEIEDDYKEIAVAKEAMSAVVDAMPGDDDSSVGEMLDGITKEMQGLADVHKALTVQWEKLQVMGKQQFLRMDSRELGKQIRAIQEELAKLPNKMRTYEVYGKFLEILNQKKKMNKNLLGELCAGGIESPILKHKHWLKLFKLLGIKKTSVNAISLEDLWSINLMKYAEEIRTITMVAQGENALENFLKDLDEKWQSTLFELVDYKGKIALIRNWNDLMADVADALSDVMSMKQSPYFKSFERDAIVWEEKLNSAQAIFDVMVDVQRRWVYLQGVFNNSEDVKRQLGYMYQKFKGFDREFIQLMKGIKVDPLVDHWVGVEKGLFAQLESNQATLNVIQKALNEYLESQRATFARFYFIGDDDLLEIIGNATDPIQMNRHLSKMFAGLTQLQFLPDNEQVIIGMSSREGETVAFKEHVDVTKFKKIQQWLTMVEYQMRFTLASLLQEAIETAVHPSDVEDYFQWVGKFPAQVSLLATQVQWSEAIEKNLKRLSVDQSDESHEEQVILRNKIIQTLDILSNRVLMELPAALRKLYEQLITELVYQRDETRNLIRLRICSETDFKWLYRMRYYWNKKEPDVLKKLEIRISRAQFYYGFEYFGATERLVQTPLTDKAYLTLCEALHAKMGGNPFGPAGTGKTESVKALGGQLGRFVLVFCCDETFDYNAMARIFVGLCQCGAWGCFDEFNRLEETILSAVSQQILTIQNGLKENAETIKIRGQDVKLDVNVGIFVTMNPGYAGRSELPDNLKQLFRGMAMMKPNRVLIGQVMLFSQGFGSAEILSSKIVLLFGLCKDQLSKQSHYDFGLRALKSVLRSAGNLKRTVQKEMLEAEALAAGDEEEKKGNEIKEITKMDPEMEEIILIRSLMSTLVPKLLSSDRFLFDSLLESAFPGAEVQGIKEELLKVKILQVCKEQHFEPDEQWLVKLMQFHTIQNITHGVMLVGPAGSGKSAARNTLLAAMELLDGIKSEQYEIDPKAINKEQLYGILDPTTLEWTDGVFTSTLRMIIDNVRGESNKRHWIVFDGDVDPEWAENLNSVLDDNKILTLPNGERLALTPNIRIIFETPTLYYATPATVSRCGMVWFSQECVTIPMLLKNQLALLKDTEILMAPNRPFREWEEVTAIVTEYLQPIFDNDSGLIVKSLENAQKQKHVMKFTPTRAIYSLFSQLRGGCKNVLIYNEDSQYNLTEDQIKSYISKYLLYSIIWAFAGAMKLELRYEFGRQLIDMCGYMDVGIESPDNEYPLLDYEVSIEEQNWVPWKNRINNPELEPHKIRDPTVVINTIDTIRHQVVIGSWLEDLKPVILCGPPGSGKSMTLAAVLRANPQYEMITLNFSSAAGTDLIFKAFEQYCKIDRKNQGYVIRPTFNNKILTIFCDEINLPSEDLYGTQTIITFIRQIIEKGGYWHPVTKNWIQTENIQFVGACNPPTDAGRVVLSPRFLNLCPLILVDFPARESLLEIYGSFIRALLKLTPSIRSMANSMTIAMVDVYQLSQKHFNPDMQPHYVYSPRELSRWTRAMYRALADLDDVGGTTNEEIVRLWAHEALRLFSDRLVEVEEQEWTYDLIVQVATNLFSGINIEETLQLPILFSDYLSKSYVSVGKAELRDYILQRLKVFNEEELDVQLVIYDDLLDHILRIDRVLRQPLGHLLMVGASGAGKTVFSRFVSWMNGMTTFQIKVHKDYSAEDFDIDLRTILIQSGVEQQKITFIFDESNILDSAFLERMNALLASGEVPGLFEDNEYAVLMGKLREAARRDGLIIETEEELYNMFTRAIQNNLHIVFTMNPAGGDFSDRAATSPALFNRCVINWWGTWPEVALLQVAAEFTDLLDLNIGVPPELRSFKPESKEDDSKMDDDEEQPAGGAVEELFGVHLSVATSIVKFHQMVEKVMEYLANNMATSTFVTPRHYLDLIHHFVDLFDEKRTQLEEQQKHLNTGLKALKETGDEVAIRQIELDAKQKELNIQQKLAREKLEVMMESEKEASKSKKEAVRVSAEVEVEMKEIGIRSDKVSHELAHAKPALEAASKAVSNINKKQLVELKSMKKPPAVIVMVMKAVGLMLGVKKVTEWKAVGKMLADPKFKQKILTFDSKKLKPSTRKKLNKEYLSLDEFNFERVNKASKVAGPLVQWIIAQIKFAHLLDQVLPMRKEIEELNSRLAIKQKQAKDLGEQVIDLEQKIEEYKREYQRMVQRITELKNEMLIVQRSMARAKKLLEDLSEENERWQHETNNFQKQLSTLDGDCLLAAGFLTYIGYYNHTYRQILIEKWQEILEANNLPFNEKMELVMYLSSPAQQIAWKAAELPEDNLCVENAIILQRFNRYPLIIDPSGQATKFLMLNCKKNKIVRTSFLDSAFLKNLESGLRFGNALLIEDVEQMDPILNPVLNKEYQTVGGRKLIRLANKDIDFSPTFTMFLVTRDPSSSFTPDLCSRVTFVNFSVTPASLQSQCLSKILKVEAPEIDRKRTDQLRLQGEFKFQLRELEDQLLNALNSVTGNILENADLMTKLEQIKLKARVISDKKAESEKVLADIEEASMFYTPFAQACSKLYFSLESLAKVHFLYQFDLRFFLSMVEYILVSGKKGSKELPEIVAIEDQNDTHARLLPLMKALHRVTYLRTKRGLKVKDHSSFAMRIAQVYIEVHPDTDMNLRDEYMQFLLRGKGFKEGKSISMETAQHLEITAIGADLLGNMCILGGFENFQSELEGNIDEWRDYKIGPAEAKVPGDWFTGESNSEHGEFLERMVIQKVFRPDKLIRTARNFVESVFKWNLDEFESNADSLRTVVEYQCDADTPILMASTPGNDPSMKIDSLAAEVWEQAVNRKYQAFAMGSPDGYQKADDAITQATKRGTWVLLKNVHLSPGWLQILEKRLHRLTKDPQFRLFMTMEIHPKVPVTLLRKSLVIIYEPPVGIKASLQRTFNNVDGARVDRKPEERSRLYILLAWVHAVILERLRFVPMGWSKGFEFSETDLSCAMDAMDEWIDRLAQSRSNVDPNEIPWDAMHKMLVQFVYGGRVDNLYDTARLESFVQNLFSAEAFNNNFALSSLCEFTEKGAEPIVGTLGFVYPVVEDEKVNTERLSRIVEIADTQFKVVYLDRFIVLGKKRTNLNANDNWIDKVLFRAQPYCMRPAVTLPTKTKFQDIRHWVLHDVDSVIVSNPAVVGLPPRAELMILAKKANDMCLQLMSLQDIATDGAMEELSEILNRTEEDSDAGAIPAWMIELSNRAQRWLDETPEGMEKLAEGPMSIKNPLFRFMRREFTIGKKVLKKMRAGLLDLTAFVSGEIKATNDLRQLVDKLRNDKIPPKWKVYDVYPLGISHWILDFVKRISQLNKIASINYVKSPSVCMWLGGFFSPAGFIASTRQYVAQQNKWPLESLVLCVEMGEAENTPDSFVFDGLTLYGAGWDKQSGCLVLTEKTQTPLPPSRFVWKNGDDQKASGDWVGEAPVVVEVRIPVYLNSSFQQLLFSVNLPVYSALPREIWVQRAVSVSVWST